MAAVSSTLRSPKVWGSGLVGVLALVLGNWLCDRELAPTLPPTGNTQDTTTLTENTPIASDTQATGVKTISPEQLPKDVTLEQPKQKEEKPTAKEQQKEEKPATRKSGFEMVAVAGGTFTMGDAKGESDECPHEVTVGSFSIGKYEITQADWKAVMGGFPKEPGFPNCDQCPVERVSWDDIQDFLKKANAKYGKAYRLPTEAEWEYAARGGNRSKDHAYSGSSSPGSVAWYDANSGRKTHPVGGKAANELGLYDMSGNVWEWCADLWKAYPCCTASECKNCRVLRGGSWGIGATWLRSAYRVGGNPDGRDNGDGFRVAQD